MDGVVTDLQRSPAGTQETAMTCSRSIPGAWLVLCFALGGTAAAQAISPADRMLVPGERAGPIGRDMTEEGLAAIAPPDQIRREARSVGESFMSCGTVVLAGTPDEIFVRWSSPVDEVDAPDDEIFAAECAAHPPLRHPVRVSIQPTGNIPPSWRTAEGLKVGMTLAEAEAALGRALEVSVCDCDYGGTVFLVDGGLIENLRIWSGYPPDVQVALAGKVNTGHDYLLRASDIPEEMMSNFLIARIDIELP